MGLAGFEPATNWCLTEVRRNDHFPLDMSQSLHQAKLQAHCDILDKAHLPRFGFDSDVPLCNRSSSA